MNIALSAAIRSVIGLLVNKEYETIEELTDGRRLTAAMMEGAISQYGRTLRLPPDPLPDDLDVIPIDGDTVAFGAVMSLWTVEEGRSDLSLELELTETRNGLFDTQIINIRVL